MNLECAVCLNALTEPAPAPVGRDLDVNANVQQEAAPPLRKRAKKIAPLKLQHSTSLDDTFTTPCGHIFHAICLKQWFEEEGRYVVR